MYRVQVYNQVGDYNDYLTLGLFIIREIGRRVQGKGELGDPGFKACIN